MHIGLSVNKKHCLYVVNALSNYELLARFMSVHVDVIPMQLLRLYCRFSTFCDAIPMQFLRSVHISTRQYTLYTLVHISTHQYKSVHISIAIGKVKLIVMSLLTLITH